MSPHLGPTWRSCCDHPLMILHKACCTDDSLILNLEYVRRFKCTVDQGYFKRTDAVWKLWLGSREGHLPERTVLTSIHDVCCLFLILIKKNKIWQHFLSLLKHVDICIIFHCAVKKCLQTSLKKILAFFSIRWRQGALINSKAKTVNQLIPVVGFVHAFKIKVCGHLMQSLKGSFPDVFLLVVLF